MADREIREGTRVKINNYKDWEFTVEYATAQEKPDINGCFEAKLDPPMNGIVLFEVADVTPVADNEGRS